MSNGADIVHEGWLIKSPPTKGLLFRRRWRRRWFALRLGSLPHQYLLEYYADDAKRKVKGSINLDECEQLVGPLAVQERHKHTFKIRTPERTYFLSADSESEMSKWVSSLCQVCSLKSAEEDGEGYEGVVYTRAGDENKPRLPEAREVQGNRGRGKEDASESDDSSPTLSESKVMSGPYIPISECFTGKPILHSDESTEVSYCNVNTVFQFPPKVNWATHPSKRDTADDSDTTPTSPEPKTPTMVAPPRPPKPKKNMISPHDRRPFAYSDYGSSRVSPNGRPFVYHEYEQANEMKGTYLQIDCHVNKDADSPKSPVSISSKQVIIPRKGMGHLHPDPSSAVEYRLIDPVMTEALNKTREDREKQLHSSRNNTLNRTHHH